MHYSKKLRKIIFSILALVQIFALNFILVYAQLPVKMPPMPSGNLGSDIGPNMGSTLGPNLGSSMAESFASKT